MLDVERRNNISLYVGTESRNIGTPVPGVSSKFGHPTNPTGRFAPQQCGWRGGRSGARSSKGQDPRVSWWYPTVRDGDQLITQCTARSSAVHNRVAQYYRQGPLVKTYRSFRACDADYIRGRTS